jgi:hypothetical protein
MVNARVHPHGVPDSTVGPSRCGRRLSGKRPAEQQGEISGLIPTVSPSTFQLPGCLDLTTPAGHGSAAAHDRTARQNGSAAFSTI